MLYVIYIQGVLERVIKFHDGSLVTTSVAIIRCAEDCYHITFMTPVITL